MVESTASSPIYTRLRFRLAVWYVVLSGITSFALVICGTWLCYNSINESLDKTLEDMIASNLPQVQFIDDKPRFLFADEKVSNEWAHQRSTVQLYDKQGNFVQEFGPPGVKRLELSLDNFEDSANGIKVRATSDPIIYHGATAGYIQAEVPVDIRDQSTKMFATVMAAIMPLLLLVLGLSGYFFSGKASRPAEQAFNLLKQFMADASHELRTPVHAIQLTAENAALDAEPDSQVAKDMESIVRSTDRMGRLIDDMLMLTKMELQQMPMKKVSVAIDKLIVDCAESLRPSFTGKNLELKVGDLPPVTVEGDPDALFRVVTNLLQNALRYTDSGGIVKIDLQVAEANVEIKVADSGIGIDAQSLKHIFDRFYRVDKSRARAQGGSGLGLSIVKAICDHHHGTIDVASTEGRGTTFTVTLPRTTAAAQ